MNFEKFLEDYDWFDKTKSVGSHFLNPTSRPASYAETEFLSHNDHFYFNDVLEDFADAEPDIKKQIKNYKGAYRAGETLMRLIQDTKINREYHVYRTFGGKVDVAKLGIGDIIPGKAGRPISTSLSWVEASMFSGVESKFFHDNQHHNWTCKIKLPKGLSGFYMDVVDNHNDHEKEMLLPPTVKIKVVGFSYCKLPDRALHFIDCVATQ